jgi:hypothetical protein
MLIEAAAQHDDVINGDAERGDQDKTQKPKKIRKEKVVGGMTIGGSGAEDKLETYLDLLHLNSKAVESTTQAAIVLGEDSYQPTSNGDDLPRSPEPDTKAPIPPKTKNSKNDPINMFGLFTPPALHQAQASFVDSVTVSMPKLLELDTEMNNLEIEIRRTRKLLAKSV